MAKNIKIEIGDEVYNRLKKEAEERNLDLDKYISNILTKHEHTINMKSYIEEKIKKPLNGMIIELEKLNTDSIYNKNIGDNTTTKLELIPLKKYKKSLPEKFIKLINYFKNKGWYNDSSFYLITDKKRILGYLGLNIFEEDAPYGKYIFIYTLNLHKDYQNINNLKHLISFIQSLARKSKCYGIDTLIQSSNFTKDQLNKLGFLDFIVEDAIEIKNFKEEFKFNKDIIKIKKISIENFGDFYPVSRIEPLKPLYNKLEDKEFYKVTYPLKDEEIKFIYIKQIKKINNKEYDQFTLFVEPKNIYNDEYIIKSFSILKSITIKEINNNICPIIKIPKSINKDLTYYTEDDVLYTVNRLRKNHIF